MNLIAALEISRNQALDRAALLGALSVSHVPVASEQQQIRERLHAQIAQALYEFAFSARRYIELAGRLSIPMRAMAEKPGLIAVRSRDGAEVLNDKVTNNLWWALGRIIHSDAVELEDRVAISENPDTDSRTVHPWGFRVRSDKDAAGDTWFVFLDFFVERFLEVDGSFERDVALLLRQLRSTG